ncbi:MAG: acyltransferase family protein [Actinobacteria bacterium]|nr:acyltransferase family protein [Actinomycetota bacterium]
MTLTTPRTEPDSLFDFEQSGFGARRVPKRPAAVRDRRGIPHQPALDGIRGAAVLAVVLYHGEFALAGQPLALGGYLGVDAFFVLSGYLITSLLLSEWRSRGTIKLGEFWSRRARRLLPALFVTLGLVALYAVLFAKPDNLEQIRWDGIASLFYVTNWRFVATGQSYFQQFLFRSPLQHTWSLAIEEQWYLIWPLVVLGVLRWRRSIRAVFWASILLGVASVLWMAWLFAQQGPGGDPSRVYFGTDTRAQSLLIGAALGAAVAGGLRTTTVRSQALLGWLGLGAGGVLLYYWVTTPDTAVWIYSGGFLFLSLAVAFLIFAATQPGAGRSNPIRSALSFTPLRWLGLISYGVYLYHWPIMMILNGERTGLTGLRLLALRIIVTLVVATVSYLYLEKPIRYGALARIRFSPALLPVTAIITLVVMVVVTANARSTLAFQAERDVTNRAAPSVRAGDGAAGSPSRVLLIGDSVSYNLGLGFEGELNEKSDVVLWNKAILWCELIEAPRREKGKESPASDACRDWKGVWGAAIDQYRPDLVVLDVGAWEIFDRKVDGQWIVFGTEEFDRMLTAKLQEVVDLAASRGTAIALLTSPYFERNDDVSSAEWTQNDRSRVDRFNELERKVAADPRNQGKATVIELGKWLCPDEGPCREKIDDVAIRDDGLHYGKDGAFVVAKWLVPQFREIALQYPRRN